MTIFAAADAAWAQCAMCKAALSSSPEGRAIGAQFNRAILVMLAAPYVVFGSFTAVLLRRPIRERLLRLMAHFRVSRQD